MTNNITKWYTISEFVDTQTGELLTESEVKRKYIIKKTLKKYEINGNIGTCKITKECEKNRQTALFED